MRLGERDVFNDFVTVEPIHNYLDSLRVLTTPGLPDPKKRARLPFGKRAPLLDLAMFPLPFSKIPSAYQSSRRGRPGKLPEGWSKKLQVPLPIFEQVHISYLIQPRQV